MQTLKYVIGKDYRPLTPLEAKTSSSNQIDYGSKPNWIQGRQYEDSLRQVFIEITYDDGTPYDLTGTNLLFEGILPDGEHRIIDNSHTVFYDDPTSGKVRFDLPAKAFSVAGQYKQAFFRVMKDYKNIATLEFKFEVLADWVISGLQPRDYISPLEEFFSQINDELLADKDKLTQAVTDFKNEVNGLYSALKTQSDSMATLLDALGQRVSVIEQKIKDDDIFTRKEAQDWFDKTSVSINGFVDDIKKSINNEALIKLTQGYIDDTTFDYDDGLPSYMQDSFDSATQNVPHGNDILNIAFITDNHLEEDGLSTQDPKQYAARSLNHYEWFAKGTQITKPDAVVLGGDNINGNSVRPTLLSSYKHVKGMMEQVHPYSPVFYILGNHDDGIGQAGETDVTKTLSEDDLKNLFNTKNNIADEVRDSDSLYFYKDFEDKKIRLIGLNSEDLPYDTQDGQYKYRNIDKCGFGVKQLTWLADTALKLPNSEYQVILFFHHPLNSANLINVQALIEILLAFKKGISITINRNDADYMQIQGLNADFTSQGKGTIIAAVTGHAHKDALDTTSLDGTPVITTDASLTNSTPDQVGRRYTVNEDCWDTISVNRTERKITCYRFGRGQTRKFTY